MVDDMILDGKYYGGVFLVDEPKIDLMGALYYPAAPE